VIVYWGDSQLGFAAVIASCALLLSAAERTASMQHLITWRCVPLSVSVILLFLPQFACQRSGRVSQASIAPPVVSAGATTTPASIAAKEIKNWP